MDEQIIAAIGRVAYNWSVHDGLLFNIACALSDENDAPQSLSRRGRGRFFEIVERRLSAKPNSQAKLLLDQARTIDIEWRDERDMIVHGAIIHWHFDDASHPVWMNFERGLYTNMENLRDAVSRAQYAANVIDNLQRSLRGDPLNSLPIRPGSPSIRRVL